MSLLNGFNAEEVEPTKGFDAIPAGLYSVAISDSEEVQTKDKKGKYLKLTFEILEGPYQNRKLWENLNLENANQQTVDIARATLSAICRATGCLRINESHELHNIPMQVKVSCKPRKDSPGEMENRITKYEPAGGVPASSTPARQPVAAANTTTPPWMKNK